MLLFLITYWALFFGSVEPVSTETGKLPPKEYMIKKVNEIRAKGCRCGGKRMKPTGPLVWNELLEKSAFEHAKEMRQYRFFSHFSKDGKDIGTRIGEVGYDWRVVGENIGEGQRSFSEVLRDWKKSPSHCEMMMDPRVTEMGLSRYKNKWVQHFGKPKSSGSTASKSSSKRKSRTKKSSRRRSR